MKFVHSTGEVSGRLGAVVKIVAILFKLDLLLPSICSRTRGTREKVHVVKYGALEVVKLVCFQKSRVHEFSLVESPITDLYGHLRLTNSRR